MSRKTTIAWTDHTFNPWWGCSRVSPACDHCYAADIAARFHPDKALWSGNRLLMSERAWQQPHTWNRAALKSGRRPRVFVASMADVFDNHPAVEGERARLWQLIRDTPALDWLLLTKRVGNAPRMLPADWQEGYPNVWLGATVVTQEEVDRDVPKLLQVPARVRFLSCEPLLEPVDLDAYLSRLSWVIVGGESGRGARAMPERWPHYVVNQCQGAGVPVFFKQGSQSWGKGFQDFATFPRMLKVRQYPKAQEGAQP